MTLGLKTWLLEVRNKHFPSSNGIEKVKLMQKLVHERFYFEGNLLEFALIQSQRDVIPFTKTLVTYIVH